MKVYDGSSTDGTSTNPEDPERVKVGIAEYQVASDGAVLTTSGLGSCLGVAIYDPESGVAGLVHVMLPSKEGSDSDNDAKFADSGIRQLVSDLQRRGADRENLVAKIAGGSDMLDFSETGSGIGDRNAEVGRQTLEEFDISLEGTDVGGEHGRSLRLETDTGDLVVKSANRESLRL
jgi:chemotaxis protein CheD